MRLAALIFLRIFSIALLLIAIVFTAQLAVNARAMFLHQVDLGDRSPYTLGLVYGRFIYGPFLFAAFSAAAAFISWRVARRFVATPLKDVKESVPN